jgi:hypothetical protein
MKLADGTYQTYYYLGKGGPRLRGEPGSPEFAASYNEACARKVVPPKGTLLSVLQAYQASDEFRERAPRTRSDYVAKIKLIEKTFRDFPLAALTDKRTRGVFKVWREQLATSSRRQADYAWVVLARVLSSSIDPLRLIPVRGRAALSRLSRRERLDWCDEAAFIERPGSPTPAIVARLVDGTTPGRPAAAHGQHTMASYQATSSKGGRRVVVPVGAPLKAALDAAKVSPIILTTLNGTPWTPDGFAHHGQSA